MDIDLSRYDPTTPWREVLSKFNACSEGVEYSTHFAGQLAGAAEAWDRAQNPEFLLWVLEHVCGADASAARAFMCWCLRHTPFGAGRTVWELLVDERSRKVVEVAERHARGEATEEELVAARHDAQAAFTVIEDESEEKAVRFASRAAPRVAARAKIWDAAVMVVWDTVKAAAHAALRDVPDDASEGVFENAYVAALKSQADFLRAKYGNPARKHLIPPKG